MKMRSMTKCLRFVGSERVHKQVWQQPESGSPASLEPQPLAVKTVVTRTNVAASARMTLSGIIGVVSFGGCRAVTTWLVGRGAMRR